VRVLARRKRLEEGEERWSPHRCGWGEVEMMTERREEREKKRGEGRDRRRRRRERE